MNIPTFSITVATDTKKKLTKRAIQLKEIDFQHLPEKALLFLSLKIQLLLEMSLPSPCPAITRISPGESIAAPPGTICSNYWKEHEASSEIIDFNAISGGFPSSASF